MPDDLNNGPAPTEPKDSDPGKQKPATPTPSSGSAGETPSSGVTAEERAELERLRAIHADEQKWEKRNKANLAKLRDLAQDLGISREEFNPAEFDPKSEVAKLRQEIEAERNERTRAEVAAETGIPRELISGGTGEEMRANAAKILAFAKANAPAPEIPPVPNASEVKGDQEIKGTQKVTAAEYKAITDPEERRKLRESGLVEGFGIPRRQRPLSG